MVKSIALFLFAVAAVHHYTPGGGRPAPFAVPEST